MDAHSRTLTDRPVSADRICDICKATVAAWDAVMVCHCYEIPWKRVPGQSPEAVTDEMIEAGQALYDAIGNWSEPQQGWFTPEVIAAGERWCEARAALLKVSPR